MGSVRSPLWRHGGTVHGPVPRDYSYKLPRKMQLGALRSALSAKLRDGELKIVSAFQLADHKTKSFTRRWEARSDEEGSAGRNGENRNLELSARNLEGVKLVRSHEVHPYQLLGREGAADAGGGGEAQRNAGQIGPETKEAQVINDHP
jgi:large subunit ribosomal protein L4